MSPTDLTCPRHPPTEVVQNDTRAKRNTPVEAAVASGVDTSVVLAVSGGANSMALLVAAAYTVPERVAVVATFDHGTGEAAREAAARVAATAERFGFPWVVGRSEAPLARREAAWRAARWDFFRSVAGAWHARVATAHTQDDQIETVVMRLLRGAGARGLAGLYANTGVIRPLLDLPGDATRSYLVSRGVDWIEDPSNTDRAFLRNRVRLDLIPSMRRVRPQIVTELLSAAREAAAWRDAFERLTDSAQLLRPGGPGARGAVAVSDLAGYDAHTLAALWPVLAARAGVTLDRRGTSRLAAFTIRGKVGGVIQLSGGIEVLRTHFWFVIR